jgi:branched-chain amino acid transport system substrate-binding protein
MTQRKMLAAGAAILVLTGLAVTAAAVDTGEAAGTATVRVGIVYSKTGLLAAYGAQYVQGLKLGLKYATKGTGKVNGKKIEIKYVDDAGSASQAVSAFKDLVGQGYKILGGTVVSGIALQLAPLAAQNRVLYISGPAASDAITGNNRYTFRSGRQVLQDVLAIQGILGKKAVGKKILVFAQDTAFGQGNLAAVKNVLGGKGHNISSILVPLSASDFTPFARQAKDAKPNLLFVAWAGDTATAVWRAMEQQGVLKSTKVATGLAEQATWPFYVSGIDFLSHYVYNAPKTKVNKWLVAHTKGHKPDLFVPDGFVAAQMIVRAVAKGGGSDVDKMVSSLEGWKFNAPKGNQQIRKADHAMLQPMFEVTLKFKGSKITPVPKKTFGEKTVAPPIAHFPS